MGRGKFLSRRHEPAKSRSPGEVENLGLEFRNPLVNLGLAFKKVRKLAPERQPSPSEVDVPVSRRPLVNINDVQKYLRKKLGITAEISTIPSPDRSLPALATTHLNDPVSQTSSETTHMSSEHGFSSDPSSLPAHDAASGARVFDIGTVGHPILEVNERRQRKNSVGMEQPTPRYSWFVDPPTSTGAESWVDMEDVQEFVNGVVEVVRRYTNWRLPETSWVNKMPWHSPPPKILAKGLQRPPQNYASEEEKWRFNRTARQRKRFLTGCPPTWSFMVANLALIAFLVYNPLVW